MIRPLRTFSLLILAVGLASCESVAPLDGPTSSSRFDDGGSPSSILESAWADREVSLCHATGAGSYERVAVAQSALRTHLRHGDEIAGGSVLDDRCAPVAAVASCTCFDAADLAASLADAQPVPYVFFDVFGYYGEDPRRTEVRSTLDTSTGRFEEVASVYITPTGDPTEPLVPLCYRQDVRPEVATGEPEYVYTTREVSIPEAEACRIEIEAFAAEAETCQGEACRIPYAEEQLDPAYPPYHDTGYRTPYPVLDALKVRIEAVAARLSPRV